MEYPGNNWRPFDRSVAEISTVQDGSDNMGVRVGDRIFFSGHNVDPEGITWYRFKPSVPVATFAQAAE